MILVLSLDQRIFSKFSLQPEIQGFQQIDGRLIARHTVRFDAVQIQLRKSDLYDPRNPFFRITTSLIGA